MATTRKTRIDSKPLTEKAGVADTRKELFSAIDAIASRGGITRDRAITAWYAATLLGIDEDEAIDAATVDGPEDNGCDFIYVDVEHETIYVLQGYVSDRPERPASIRKWNALVAAVASIRDPISFEHSGRSDIYALLQDPEAQNYSLVFGLVTLAAKSDQIARQRETTVRSKTYGSNISFFYEYQESLYDKYLIAKTTDRTVPEDTLTFNSGGLATIKGDFGQAIVGAVPASELARWYEKYGNQLFEGNVRLFIGQRKGGINAIEESDEAAKAQVLVRVVAAKKALLTDIVRYNNTQNPVKISAVRLLDPIQEALRQSFERIGYSYAPKQEGARLSRNPKKIELDRVAQYLAAVSEETILDAVRRKSDLFDRSYKAIFPRGLQPGRVFLAWLLAQEVERERIDLLNANEDSDDLAMKAILGIHGTPWGIYVASMLIEHCGSDLSKLVLRKMDTQDFRNALAKYAKKAMELYSEIAVNIVTSAEEDSNVRNEIRVRPFLDKLKRTLSLRMARSASWRLPKLQAVAN